MARTSLLSVAVVTAIALGACGGSAPSPAPPESYTSFAPVELRVNGGPDWMAADSGSIWVRRYNGLVSRIDSRTTEVVAEIEADTSSPADCNGMGVSADAVWSCSAQDLVRIDPVTNAVIGTIAASKVFSQGRLVEAAGHIWVLAGNGDQLVGVATADGTLTDPIPLPAACTDLGAVGDTVYAACADADTVFRVDPVARSVTAQVSVPEPYHVSPTESAVWVAGADGLVRLDPLSLAAGVSVPGIVTGYLGGIRADSTSLWVRRSEPFLTRVDATTGAQTLTITAPLKGGGDVLVDGTHVWTSTPDHAAVVRLTIPSAD